ncbi:MAG: hypothetical protein WBD97_14025, partial [Pseudolabrys sp.]
SGTDPCSSKRMPRRAVAVTTVAALSFNPFAWLGQSTQTILQKLVLANPGTTAGTSLALISGRLFYWRDSPVRPRTRNIRLLACQLVDDPSSMRAGFCIQLAC